MKLESLVSEKIRNFYPGEVFIVFRAWVKIAPDSPKIQYSPYR